MEKKRFFSASVVYVCLCLAPKSLIPRVSVPDCDARVLSRLSRNSSVRTFPFEKDLLTVGVAIHYLLFIISEVSRIWQSYNIMCTWIRM